MPRAFELNKVRLLPGPIQDRQALNTRYLLSLDPDRLLHTFRLQAGLTSSAEPLGGWEAPDCGLRGHFVGHYLSACSQGYAATADDHLRKRAELMLNGLIECQRVIGTGYLSAFPESDLDTLETEYEGPWASYYTLHKILTGLLDVYRWCCNMAALLAAIELAEYIRKRIEGLSSEQLEGMCRTDKKPNPTNEYGGLSEVFQDLADVTDRQELAVLAAKFDRDWFIDPLTHQEDHLTGLHANTHIAMALGLARRYEQTGDAQFRDAADYFWERTAIARSYVNGGGSGPRPDGTEKSTGGEHWPEPFKLADTLTPKINESCVTHNMMRLTDALFRWTNDEKYAGFYERAYFNHVLTMQHPGYPGGYLYDHPLGQGSCKKFGHAHDAFWCCYGSSVEAFARLGAGIYYYDDDALWINLFISSVLDWADKHVRITQVTRFTEEECTGLLLNCDEPVALTLHVRMPTWSKGITATINGEEVDVSMGPYLVISRTWHDGDQLDITLPMAVYPETMPDDPMMVAFRCGPLVLAARTDTELNIQAKDAATAAAGFKRSGEQALTFHTNLANGERIEVVPLNQIIDEPFGVYHHLVNPGTSTIETYPTGDTHAD